MMLFKPLFLGVNYVLVFVFTYKIEIRSFFQSSYKIPYSLYFIFILFNK